MLPTRPAGSRHRPAAAAARRPVRGAPDAGAAPAGGRRGRSPGARGALALSALLALGVAASAGGCSASDCRVGVSSNPLMTFRGGNTFAADRGAAGEGRPPVYFETSAPDGEHLDFHGGARVCIYHGLGGRPFRVEPWVSFSPTGTWDGNEAKPAGNMLEVSHVDACVIIVRNDSCGDYFLRVTASEPVGVDPAAPPDCSGAAVDPCVELDEPQP